MRVRVLVYNVKAFRLGVRKSATLVSEHSLFRRSIHNAVLVRRPWHVISKRLHRFPRDVRFYPRGALVVRAGRADHRLWAVSVHLGLTPGARRRNAEELLSQILRLAGPVVAGGDLNEGPTGDAVSLLSERLRDAWTRGGEGTGETFRSDGPRARIDYLFVTDHVTVERAVVIRGSQASAS